MLLKSSVHSEIKSTMKYIVEFNIQIIGEKQIRRLGPQNNTKVNISTRYVPNPERVLSQY